MMENIETLYSLEHKIGRGASCRVYPVKGQPTRIYRIQTNDVELEDILHEIKLTSKMTRLGVCPIVYVQVIDKNDNHAMLMQRYQMSLCVYFKTGSNTTLNEFPTWKVATIFIDPSWEMTLVHLLRITAKANILCLDIKPENVVVNLDHENKRIIDLKLIDFGDDLCQEVRHYHWRSLFTIMMIMFSVHLRNFNQWVHSSLQQRISNQLRDPVICAEVIDFMCSNDNNIEKVWKCYVTQQSRPITIKDYLNSFLK